MNDDRKVHTCEHCGDKFKVPYYENMIVCPECNVYNFDEV